MYRNIFTREISNWTCELSSRLLQAAVLLILTYSYSLFAACSSDECWSEVNDISGVGDPDELFGVCGHDVYGVYAVGWDIALKYDGSEWSVISRSFGGELLYDVWTSPSGTVFTVGSYGFVRRLIDEEWEVIYSLQDGSFSKIWGTDDNNLYIVGSNETNGLILHYQSGAWHEEFSWPDLCFGDIWGSSADNVYVVGCGKLLHYGGESWVELQPEVDFRAGHIWGASENDIFAVGLKVFHYNGSSWSIVDTGNEQGGVDVWGRDGNDVFVVNDRGVAMHYNGDIWNDISTSKRIDLEAVGGYPDGEVFAVGNAWKDFSRVGKLLRYTCH